MKNAVPVMIEPSEVRVERDEEGRIVRVLREEGKGRLVGDLMAEDEADDEVEGEEFAGFEDGDGDEVGAGKGEGKEKNEIIRQLEEQASRIPLKQERKQSEREREWVERLVARYADDYRGMVRDRRLNPMQQTEADIRRRVEKWRASGGSVSVVT